MDKMVDHSVAQTFNQYGSAAKTSSQDDIDQMTLKSFEADLTQWMTAIQQLEEDLKKVSDRPNRFVKMKEIMKMKYEVVQEVQTLKNKIKELKQGLNEPCAVTELTKAEPTLESEQMAATTINRVFTETKTNKNTITPKENANTTYENNINLAMTEQKEIISPTLQNEDITDKTTIFTTVLDTYRDEIEQILISRYDSRGECYRYKKLNREIHKFYREAEGPKLNYRLNNYKDFPTWSFMLERFCLRCNLDNIIDPKLDFSRTPEQGEIIKIAMQERFSKKFLQYQTPNQSAQYIYNEIKKVSKRRYPKHVRDKFWENALAGIYCLVVQSSIKTFNQLVLMKIYAADRSNWYFSNEFIDKRLDKNYDERGNADFSPRIRNKSYKP